MSLVFLNYYLHDVLPFIYYIPHYIILDARANSTIRCSSKDGRDYALLTSVASAESQREIVQLRVHDQLSGAASGRCFYRRRGSAVVPARPHADWSCAGLRTPRLKIRAAFSRSRVLRARCAICQKSVELEAVI